MANCQIKNNKFFAPNGEESILYNTLEKEVGKQKAKDLFITAYTPTFISEVVVPSIKNNLRSLFSKVETIPTKPLIENRRTVVKNNEIYLYDGKTKIGRIRIDNYADGIKVKDSLLSANIPQNQGYGTELYKEVLKYALKNNVNLYSDISQAPLAKAIWNKFVNEGIAQENNGIYKVDVLGNSFDKNGEIKTEKVYEYLNRIYTSKDPLNIEEIVDIKSSMQTESSEELYFKLKEAFFNKKGLFSPTKKSLKDSKLYTNIEIERILANAKLQAKIKDTIQKLKNTEPFFKGEDIEFEKEFVRESAEQNAVGKFRINNPLKEKNLYIEQNAGKKNVDEYILPKEELDKYSRIKVIDEQGQPMQEELIYEEAVKEVEKESTSYRGISAIVNAPLNVDVFKLMKKVENWLLSYGLDIKGLKREGYTALKQYLDNPSAETKESLYRALNFAKKDKEKVLLLENKNRTYKYIENNKSEEQLFEELSLIKTNTPNVYHEVVKVDVDQMREITKDIYSKEFELYKKYFGYENMQEAESSVQTNFEGDLEYLLGDFIADFSAEILKNKNSKFYGAFKITNNGIELISEDEITLREVKDFVNSDIKFAKEIAEYSLLSKNMPNLKEDGGQKDKEQERIKAINDINSVKEIDGDFAQINREIIASKDETASFIKHKGNVFELQEKYGDYNFYVKLEKNNNLKYNNFNPTLPQYIDVTNFNIKQSDLENYAKINKKFKETDLEDNFTCL
jgi:hypothetical protein